MKKTFLLVVFLAFNSIAYSQVGINNNNPKATLDITASATDTLKVDGLLAPRLSGEQIRDKGGVYGTDQNGAIVYSTSSAMTTSGKAKNITEKGYYYYDASADNGAGTGLWVKLNNTTATAYQEPWYVANSTTPATQNTQNIFQSGKVGIGTNNPARALHINMASTGSNTIPVIITSPDMSVGDQLYIKLGKSDNGSSNTGDIKYNYQNDTNKSYLGFGTSGKNTAMEVYGNGSIGINTWGLVSTENIVDRLDVNGTVRFRNRIKDNTNSQGANGQVLAVQDSQVKWVNNIAITPAVLGVFPKSPKDMTWEENGTTGAVLTLPPGKWSVQVTILINTTVSSGSSGWFRTTFSDSSSSYQASSDIIGTTLASGSIAGPAQFGVVTGTVIINNTSGANKPYYLAKRAYYPFQFGSVDGSKWVAKDFGRGQSSEDQIVAYPMN